MEETDLKPENSFFRQPVETEPRLALSLPCTIVTSDQRLEGVLFNISYSGIGVELASAEDAESLKTLKSVIIDEIGEFGVYLRWKRGLRMGVYFSAKRSSRPVLDAYFEKTGTYPF